MHEANVVTEVTARLWSVLHQTIGAKRVLRIFILAIGQSTFPRYRHSDSIGNEARPPTLRDAVQELRGVDWLRGMELMA